jgi:sugar phosphate isomerase/epimerase
MNYGLQLYSVRDSASVDMDKTLREVAAMGYEFVEFAGFFDHPAEKIREMLDKYNLKASGTHSKPIGIAPENIEESIRYHKIIGCENYIIPGADLKTGRKLSNFISLVNEAIPVFEAEGMKLHYHNHSHEFLPNEDGRYSHYELEKKTTVNFEIDTYWAFEAGRDPIALLERLKDRISVIHLKDGIGRSGRALGEGNAPVLDVIAKAKELNLAMVVESEGLNPTGLEEVARCIEFLKKNG